MNLLGGTQLQLMEPLPVKMVFMWHRFWENHFLEMAFQVVLKFILLLKFLGQLCMLTKFTNKLVYSKKKKKRSTGVGRQCLLRAIATVCKWLMETYSWKLKRAVFLKNVNQKNQKEDGRVSASSFPAAIYNVPLFYSECIMSCAPIKFVWFFP